MNTLAPLFIVLALLIVTVVLLKIGKIHRSLIVPEGLSGFMPLQNGKAGSPENKPEDGAS